jgi:integrase
MKVTIRRIEHHGVTAWQTDYRDGGKRIREAHKSKALAEAHAEAVQIERGEALDVWCKMGVAERADVLRAMAKRTVVDESKTLGDAYDDFTKEKVASMLARKSLQWYKHGLGRFVSGRETLPVAAVTHADVSEWLANPAWSPASFNAHLSGLHIFFEWCRKRKLIHESPTATIERIPKRRMPGQDDPPAILSVSQCRSLLVATRSNDAGLIPFVACGLFAGLRPEREAAMLLKEDVRTDGFLYVRGENAKDRQRRMIPIHPALKAWLSVTGGEWGPKNLRRRFELVRLEAGLIKLEVVPGHERKRIVSTGWAQDCLRHTFASNHLQAFGAEKTIQAMGHGDYDMLFSHYRALVSPVDADEFWKLTPAVCK